MNLHVISLFIHDRDIMAYLIVGIGVQVCTDAFVDVVLLCTI